MRTPLSTHEAKAVLTQALAERLTERAFDRDPTPNQLALLFAQSSLETAAWQSMHGFNFGNIIAGEYWDGPTVELDDSGNLRQFRAYPNAFEGAKAYVRQLQRRPEWWAGLLTGSPAKFARALKTPPAYYEASEARYLSGLHARFREYGGAESHSGVGVGLFAVFILGAILAKRWG